MTFLLFKHELNDFYCLHMCEEVITLNGLMPRASFLRYTGARVLAITRDLASAASLFIKLFRNTESRANKYIVDVSTDMLCNA